MASITRPTGFTTAASNLKIQRVDWGLVSSSAVLLLFGLMSLLSQSGGLSGANFKRQLIFLVVGFVPLTIFTVVHPKVWRRFSGALYVLSNIFLVAVLFMGSHKKGAGRWIELPGHMGQLQPSELAKLFIIISVSAYYANRQDSIQKLSTFVFSFVQVLIPAILIRMQPHMGGAATILVIWFAISVVAGVPVKQLGGFVALVVVLAGVVLNVPALKSKVFNDYHIKRVNAMTAKTGGAMLSKAEAKKLEKAQQDAKYQAYRAEIAFGVGGVLGTGFMRGEQKAAGFIPEQENDFVITVLGEEGGLVGCTLLLVAYGFFFYRVFLVMLHATEPYFKMLAAGVFAVIAFHCLINIAMVLQLLPVIGLWLPFLSSGGTALWLCMSCVGLLLGVRRREKPILF